MTQPLALLFYERLLPGSQLLNRLQDLGYRVQNTAALPSLVELARTSKPLLVFVDLRERLGQAATVIQALRQNAETNHLPVIAYAGEKDTTLQDSARQAGASVVANEAALLQHLEQLMDQALRFD